MVFDFLNNFSRFCTVFAILVLICPSANAQRQNVNGQRGNANDKESKSEDVGVWDGAVWKFVLIPAQGNPNKQRLAGQFRVEKLKIYQGDSADDKEMKREIGKSDPTGGGRKQWVTNLTVEDLIAQDKAKSAQKVAFTSRLTPDGRGRCKGTAITKDGYHWEVKCQRVQE